MIIKVTNGEMSDAEQQAYLKMGVEKYPNNKIRAMEINIDGEYIDRVELSGDAGAVRILWGIKKGRQLKLTSMKK